MNLLESLFASPAKPDTPLHAGEVMTLWAYAVALDEGRAICLFMLNHTHDPDLRRMIEHYISSLEEPQSRKLKLFLREEGLTLPTITPDKGKANEQEIPHGAKLTDPEIANMFRAKLVAALQLVSAGLTTALRTDVGAMLYAFYNELLKESFVLKQTMQARGWLKIPPSYRSGKATT